MVLGYFSVISLRKKFLPNGYRDIITEEFLSIIYVANIFLIYWSIRYFMVKRGNRVKRIGGVSLY